MKCPKCGFVLPEDSVFCPYCGSSVLEAERPGITESTRPVESKTGSSGSAEKHSGPEEVLNEDELPVLMGGFPLILEKHSIMQKDGQVFARCAFRSLSVKPVRAVLLDLACYNVWHEDVRSVAGFQYMDLNVRRDESFGGEIAIPLPDAATRAIEVSVSKVAFSDGTLLQKSAAENIGVPASLSLETYLGSKELLDEYKAQTYFDAEYAPIRIGPYWRCTCGAINGDVERTCHKCGGSAELLFERLDRSALQASVDEKKRLQQEREERERIEREEARQKAEEEANARRLQEEADAKKRAEKRKRIWKRIAVAGAAIVAAALVVYLIVWQAIPALKYHQADKLLQAGDRTLAYDAFVGLGDFKDSGERANEIRYEDAELALSNGDFDTACTLFTSLSDYKDSQTQANEAVYQKGIAALDNGEFEIASAVFHIIPGYKDSDTMVKEAIYRKAMLLLGAGSYGKAAPFFDVITDYKDSKEQRDFCKNEEWYTIGIAYLDEGVFLKAGEIFESLASYRDSAELMLESYYNYAKDLIEKGDLHEAFVVLSSKVNHDGSSYEDSVDLANTSEYRYAVNCFNEGSFIEAVESFSVLGDYEDSAERCLEAKYQYGLGLISTGDYFEAAKQFEELDGYKDSSTQYQESRYLMALQYLSQGEYTIAEKVFSELGTYKDSQTQQKEVKYQEALSKTKGAIVKNGKLQRVEKNLKRAVYLFKELGDYKDSKEQWKKAMYAYVLENKNSDDMSTYEYLKELKKYDYQQSKSIYEELYKWSVTVEVANASELDLTSIVTRVSKTAPYFQFWLRLEGGPPGEKVTLTHKTYWPDGSVYGSDWYWEDKKRGDFLTIEWPDGLYDPRYATVGDLILRIYVKSTGEFIGQASVTLY